MTWWRELPIAARLRNKFEEDPPEPFSDLGEAAEDFLRRFSHLRDKTVEHTEDAPGLDAAIERAARSRDAAGKCFNHQSRVPLPVLEEYANRLREFKRTLARPDLNFEELLGLAEHCRIKGIGPVTTYDVAVRLGAYLEVYPERLYLHAGVTEGARNLGLDVSGEYLEADDLPWEITAVFGDDLNVIEDFLCAYSTLFPYIP